MQQTAVTIILPTYQEFDSLPSLIEAIEDVRTASLPNCTLIIVDDNSDDGTVQLISEMNKDWITLIIRTEDRGLSPAVIAGLHSATSEFCVVMDADGSHPPSAIPDMIKALQDGADFVVGSRYIGGGTTEDGWGVLRWLNSKVATLMARPFTKVLDPMSGFLAFRRTTFLAANNLNPVGYKIGLELIVKCDCNNVTEVPIHFRTRQLGESKLTLSVQWQYLQHIIRLLRYTHPSFVSFFTFAIVGVSGLGVYVLASMLTTSFISPFWIANVVAIFIAMTWNFFWDRRFAFWDAHKKQIFIQYIGFVLICSVGAIPNALITNWMVQTEAVPLAALLGGLVGATVGIIFNFLMNRMLVFQK
jgi:dolichol-phosphate mannosyltransferase